MDGDWNKFLGQLDYGFTFIFAIEVLLKVRYLDKNCLPDRNPFVRKPIELYLQILDYGLVLHPGSYLREMWNCMDLIVVSCAITSFTMDMMYVREKIEFMKSHLIVPFIAIKMNSDIHRIETGSFQWDLANLLFKS